MNEIDRDQGLPFYLAQFQARGSLHTQGEHEVGFAVGTRGGDTELLEPNFNPLDGEPLLGVFPGEQDGQGDNGFKMSQKEVESEQQQDRSLSPPIVNANIGKILNRPNSFIQVRMDFEFSSANQFAQIGTYQLPTLEQSEKEELIQEYHSTHKLEQWQTTLEAQMVGQTFPVKQEQLRFPEGSQTGLDAGSKQKKWETGQEQHQKQHQSDLTMNDTDMGTIYNYLGCAQTLGIR